jgi:hypothetical protein
MTPTTLRPAASEKLQSDQLSAATRRRPFTRNVVRPHGNKSFESSLWDSSGTHVASSTNKNPRFTGVLGADDGTRTHDLLHGNSERSFALVRIRSLKPLVHRVFVRASEHRRPERTPNLAILATGGQAIMQLGSGRSFRARAPTHIWRPRRRRPRPARSRRAYAGVCASLDVERAQRFELAGQTLDHELVEPPALLEVLQPTLP